MARRAPPRLLHGWPWARWLFAAAVSGALAALALALWGSAPSWWVLGALAAGLLGALVAGVFVNGSGLFARPILAVSPRVAGDRLALTFDDGPDETHTRRLLDLLEAHGQRGTFFVIGRRAAGQPALLTEMVRRGHGLGNHSFAHAYTTPFCPPDRLAEELLQTQELLQRAGERSRLFRPPVGLLSPRVVAAARRAGLTLVGWTATARDGRATTPARALSRLMRAARPGAILVLHDAAERGGRVPIAAEVLRPLLAALAARGLRSVPLQELLEPASESPSAPL